MNILCKFGIHNWTVWYPDRLNSKKDYRKCLWCKKQDTRKVV